MFAVVTRVAVESGSFTSAADVPIKEILVET